MLWWHLRKLKTTYRCSRVQATKRLDKRERSRVRAAKKLGKYKSSRAADALLEELANLDYHTGSFYTECIRSLGRIGDARAVGPLLIELDHELGYCPEAIEALGRIGDPSALNPLTRLLKALEDSSRCQHFSADRFSKTRLEIVRALCQIGTHAAVEPFKCLLSVAPRMTEVYRKKDRTMGTLYCEREHEACSLAIATLGELGGDEALDILIKMVNANWAGGHKHNLHIQAAKALGRVGDLRAFDALWELAYCSPYLDEVDAAADALGRLGQEAANRLTGFLKQRDYAWKAAEVVHRIADRRYVPDLIEALKWDIIPAAKALGLIGDIRAVEPLMEALARCSPEPGYTETQTIRWAILDSLEQLGDPRPIKMLVAMIHEHRRLNQRYKDCRRGGGSDMAMQEVPRLNVFWPLLKSNVRRVDSETLEEVLKLEDFGAISYYGSDAQYVGDRQEIRFSFSRARDAASSELQRRSSWYNKLIRRLITR